MNPNCGTNKGMTTLLQTVVVPLFFLASCHFDRKEFVNIVFDPEIHYTMKAIDVSKLVSDSGVVKYRAEAQEWFVFDKANEPYWYFPEKVHIEKFDTLFRIEASFDADTAYYYTRQKLWKFIGNVDVRSVADERFETSLMYWDQDTEKVYSDQFIRITKNDFVNTGIGFESNQTLTSYKIFNSGAIIPVREETRDTTEAGKTPPP
ncbi:MAG: LPS export ABC transporter periplasmic protein LptC [Tannerella sp.]|jgi:LPS export ABC transporter protein LptC|nr:LPS export ABC transporter periplasmic protein LptC [Tannerella sp.]